MDINLFGNGFVGMEFVRQFVDGVIVNERNDLYPKINKILYTISTVDNYNIWINPHLDIDTNLTTLIKVLENCRARYGNEFEFNFISSWFVYGKVSFPASEESPCNPTGFYSITKYAAELLLKSYCDSYKISYRILRLSNVIGIQDNKVSKKKNALQYMIQQLVLKEEVSLYEGKILRDLIDVRDCVKAIKLVMDNGNLNEIYNVGNGFGYSFEELVYKVQTYLQSGTIKRIPIPEFHKKVQVQDMYLDTTKLQSLGYAPEHEIEKVVIEIADYYLRNS